MPVNPWAEVGYDWTELMKRCEIVMVEGETDVEVARGCLKYSHSHMGGGWVRVGLIVREGRVFRQVLTRLFTK